MAILQVSSNNPNISHILCKNPNSGIQARRIRRGVAFGYYKNETNYSIYFRDAENEISYPLTEDEKFEYLNLSRYNISMCYMNIISEFLNQNLKKIDEEYEKEGYEYIITIPFLEVPAANYVDFYQRYFPDCVFTFEPKTKNNYSMVATSTKSLHHVLHNVSTLLIFNAAIGYESFYVNEEVVDKYIKSINIIDAHYFIRYLFKKNAIRSEKKFDSKFKALMEDSDRCDIQMTFGSSFLTRKKFIYDNVPVDLSIVEVGCGEGQYIRLAERCENLYCIDTDKEKVEIVERKAIKYGYDNIITSDNFQKVVEELKDEEVNVVFTEVIEHMTDKEIKKAFKAIREMKVSTLLITTPNVEFNQFYMIGDGEFRHDDHLREYSKQEFDSLLDSNLDCFHKEFVPIGDIVNNQPTTLGYILKRIEGGTHG